jgi:hypothetical protein
MDDRGRGSRELFEVFDVVVEHEEDDDESDCQEWKRSVGDKVGKGQV